MTYEALVYAAFAAALAIPALPAALELRSRRDASALALDPEYAMNPRYLGKSFRHKIAAAIAGARTGSEIRFLDRANERARIVDGQELPAGAHAEYALLARGAVSTGERARLTDVYSAGHVQIGSGTQLRTLVADGETSLAQDVTIARWVDSEGDLRIGARCAIAHSASSGGMCTLESGVAFRRLFGSPIVAGSKPEPLAPAPATEILDTDTISTDSVEIRAGSVHTGSIKSGGDVIVRAGARIDGSIVARGSVRLERSAAVGGHVFSERSIAIGENAVVGAPGGAKTVYASGNISLSPGATIYGWIICEGQGETQ